MKTDIYWVQGPWPGRLAIMPRPRGGDWLEDEIRSWRRSGVDMVVSLLTPEEIADFDLTAEEAYCHANGIEYASFPIHDRGVPASRESALALLEQLTEYLKAGKNVAIHCRQGIGRAGLMAAGLLALSGMDPDAATEKVGSARGCTVPETPEQRRWIAELTKAKALR
jgi:protein-tyrosine phosphatase